MTPLASVLLSQTNIYKFNVATFGKPRSRERVDSAVL